MFACKIKKNFLCLPRTQCIFLPQLTKAIFITLGLMSLATYTKEKKLKDYVVYWNKSNELKELENREAINSNAINPSMNDSYRGTPNRTYSPNMNGGPHRGDNSLYSLHNSQTNIPWNYTPPASGHKSPADMPNHVGTPNRLKFLSQNDRHNASDSRSPYDSQSIGSPLIQSNDPHSSYVDQDDRRYRGDPDDDRADPRYYNDQRPNNRHYSGDVVDNNMNYQRDDRLNQSNTYPTEPYDATTNENIPYHHTDTIQPYPETRDPYRDFDADRLNDSFDPAHPYIGEGQQHLGQLQPYETRPSYTEDVFGPTADDPYRQRDSGGDIHSDEQFNTSQLPAIDRDPFREDPFTQQHSHPHDVPPYAGHLRDEAEPTMEASFHEPPYSYQQETQPRHSYHDDDGYPDSVRDDLSHRDDPRGGQYRSPDLQEVIEYLSHHDDSIKANAAAYLTHLSYMDNDMKAKIRAMNGIPALVDLLLNEYPHVCRNVCSALKNLSYGPANSENKVAIRNANGVPHLIRVLRMTTDLEVFDLITAILWNMSSLKDIKTSVLDDALTMLVALVLVKSCGWERHKLVPSTNFQSIQWTTTLVNTTGVIRNLSSSDERARKRLRECEALIPCVIHLVKLALEQQTRGTEQETLNNKCIENCACIMRNLSYRCQETSDPDFDKKKPTNQKTLTQSPSKVPRTGCFGSKKKVVEKSADRTDSSRSNQVTLRGSEALWNTTIVSVYAQLLMECSNAVTLEATLGAIRNVSACSWQPSVEFREAVRREKCLPIIVDLLSVDSDPVVCAAIGALHNLSVNERNMELIGKYAMEVLVSKLPLHGMRVISPDSIVQATLRILQHLINKNSTYASSVVKEKGVARLNFITTSSELYLEKTLFLAKNMLLSLWNINELHPQYKALGLTGNHFSVHFLKPRLPDTPMPRSVVPPDERNHPSAQYNNTSRSHSRLGYDDHTHSPSQLLDRSDHPDHRPPSGLPYSTLTQHSEPNMISQSSSDLRPQHPPQTMHEMTTYASLMDQHRARPTPPPGGVPLFPTQNSDSMYREPLYAKVNKGKVPMYDDGLSDLSRIQLQDHQTVTNADSWV